MAQKMCFMVVMGVLLVSLAAFLLPVSALGLQGERKGDMRPTRAMTPYKANKKLADDG